MGVDDEVSVAEIARKAEEIGPDLEAQIREGIYENTVAWIEKTFPDKFRRTYPPGNNQESKIRLAQIQGELSVALSLLVVLNDEPLVAGRLGLNRGESGNLWQLMFSDRAGSIATCCNTRRSDVSEAVRDQLAGTISNLTLVQLISESDPALATKARIHDILVNPRVDVQEQYDLRFDFGDKNEKGEKIVRIVSLKSHRDPDVRICAAEPGRAKILGVERESIDTMLRAAKKLQTRLDTEEKRNGGVGVEVRCFVAAVPRYDAPCVMNPTGRISANALPGLASVFKEDASKCGFLPSRKEGEK